jgi:HEPN domain-containing protein
MRRVEDLLEDAEDSLGAAKDLFTNQRWAKACFMSQQSAELALKAALNALGRERKGHDIHVMVEELSEEKEEISTLMDGAKRLDQYYIPTRYMNAFSEGSAKSHFTEEQAKEAIEIAEKILLKVKKIVSEARSD